MQPNKKNNYQCTTTMGNCRLLAPMRILVEADA